MSSTFTTNLGNAAQANYLIADTQIRSPNFSQPFIVVGSGTTPSATATTVYVAGINKYIFYSPLTTATAITQVYTISGMPAGFGGLYTVEATNMAVATASFSTAPIISAAHLSLSDTTDILSINPLSSTSPAFATGTAYLKVVIQFTLDI